MDLKHGHLIGDEMKLLTFEPVLLNFFPEVWPFENFGILNCQQDISKRICARDLKLCHLI